LRGGRCRVEADNPRDRVRALVHKATGWGGSSVVDQNTDLIIDAKASLHLSEVARIGEVGLQDIDGHSSFPAQAICQLLHAGAIARD
jgi:hypothetical protein